MRVRGFYSIRSWLTCAAVPTLLGIANPLAAQTLDESLLRRLNLGATVRLDTVTAGSIKGHVASVAPDALTIRIGKHTTRVLAADLVQVKERYWDPVGDGAKRGAVAGFAAGAALGLLGAVSDCGDSPYISMCNLSGFLLFPAMVGSLGAGLGAVIGTVSDAAMPAYRELYRTPTPPPMTTAHTGGTRGTMTAALIVRW